MDADHGRRALAPALWAAGVVVVVVLVVVVGLVVARMSGGGSAADPADSAERGAGVSGSDFAAGKVTCPDPTTTVRTPDDLQAALSAAAPGDVIGLADGIYTGSFVADTKGEADKPIFLCGGPGAVLDGGGIRTGYVLHLDGADYWRVVGFTVRDGQKGVVADGSSHGVIQDLTVSQIGDEGIHLRSFSTDNLVIGNNVSKTGLRRDKFGEGIYVGSAASNWRSYSGGNPDRSDNNAVVGNTIHETGAESIDIKEGTTGGTLSGNDMDGTGMTGADSLVDVKGNSWLVEANTGVHAPKDGMQTHHILDGWGSHNVFRRNVVDIDGNGVTISIHDADTTDNTVACDNRTGDGGKASSNVDCRG